MKKPLALFLIINLFLTNLYAQSSLSSVIYDSINNIVYSGDTIQLNCANSSIVLSPKIFAPGATNSYIVDSIPYNPPCSFDLNEYPDRIDYLLLYDDVWSEVLNINFGQANSNNPFIFSFYEQDSLTQFVIGSNGLLSWNLSVASGNGFVPANPCTYSAGVTIPSMNAEFLNCIFAPYHDIFYSQEYEYGKLYYNVIGEYPLRKLIISFYDVPLFGNTSIHATSMLVLYETTNVIEFYLQNKPCCTSTNNGYATLGIQNQTGTQATFITNSQGVEYNSTEWQATNEAWRIRPNSQLSNSSKWYKRSLSSNIRTEVSSTNRSIIAFTDSIEGGQYYILETSFYALNGDTITISDSSLVLPQTALVNSQYGRTINATICNGETYSLNGFSANSTGIYSRLVQTSNGCDSTVTLNLLVDTIQTPTNLTINSDTNYLQLEWEGNGESYIIYRNEDYIGSTTQRIYIDTNVVQGINYCYKIRAINTTCESELSNIECAMLLNLNSEIDSKISISLYPNPTEKETKLEIEGLTEDADVFVLDLNGRILNTYKYSLDQKQLIIDVSGFAKGVYSIKVNSSNFNTVKKIVVN
ncbi:MAG: T9SS type A sorting domain-containing protein [Bacteroidales bacterium]|nr:T9SS type A sorting domain-containing protein [Bacteroidales bacterium]